MDAKGRAERGSKPDDVRVRRFVESLLEEDMHVKRVGSIADAVSGVLNAASLAVHAIGAGLAGIYGLDAKHATKQVDRLLSNAGIDLDQFFALWVPWVLAERKDLMVTLDWTEFDRDGHATLSMNVATTHGRATPLLWHSFDTKDRRLERPVEERQLITQLKRLLPDDVSCTLLADRWFGNQELYEHCYAVGIDFICRFRGVIKVENVRGEVHSAAEWLGEKKRVVELRDARVTEQRCLVAKVVLVHDADMDEAWFLATSRGDMKGREVVASYGRRFTTEECFRDQKNPRYGLGLSETKVGRPDRRDRLLLVASLAQALLTLLGAAAERSGVDRAMKVNTVKHRTHSLFRQGLFWYSALPNQPDKRAVPLITAFEEILREQRQLATILGVL